MEVGIRINSQQKVVQSGLVSIADLYKIADCGEKQIFLKPEDGISIPIVPGEYLLIHGGENFVTGERPTEDNPPLLNKIRLEFNGSHDLALSNAKITGKALKEQDYKLPQGRLFADIKDGVDMEIADDMTIVVQDADSYFVIPPVTDADDGSSIDIEECGKHERRPPKGHKYRIRIDGDKYAVDSAEITGAAILALVGKKPDEWSLNQKLHGGKRIRIKAEDAADLTHPGIERFETVRRQAQQGDG